MKTSATMFHFRKEKIRDEEGKVIGEKAKRDSVELALPELEVADLLTIVENGGKELELLLSAANTVFYNHARELVADAIANNDSIVVNQALIDAASISWEKIANLPPAARTSTGISKETMDAFIEDYCEVMAVVLPNKPAESIKLAATHLAARFNKCRTDKAAVGVLRGYLAQWFAATTNAEDFAQVYEALDNRADTLLNTEAKLADAL